MPNMHTHNHYWLTEDPENLADHMHQYHGRWTQWGSNQIVQAWVRNTIQYYSTILDSTTWDTALSFEGEQGELVRMMVPKARKLIRQLTTVVTKQKLHFNAMARTQGTDVVREARLGNALAAMIVDDYDYDLKMERMVEGAFVHGMSFLMALWDEGKGKKYARGPHGIVYEGDLDVDVFGVFDVFWDYRQKFSSAPWAEVRRPANRWDLVAQYPELKQEILALEGIRDWRGPQYTDETVKLEDDLVYCYYLFAKPSPALPKGRCVMYGDSKTIFKDEINKYGKIPITEMTPERVFGTGFGYPVLSNLMPAQEMLDHSFSAWATNQSAHAVQTILNPRGSGISLQELQGMNFMDYTPANVPGGGKPEALQLTSTAPETLKFIEYLNTYLEDLSDVVGALRGTPPPGVTSGTAIATVTANALEFISSATKHYVKAAESGIMDCINAFRRFNKDKTRLVRVSDKNNINHYEDYLGKQLDPIQSVSMTVANPLMQTVAGRTEIAEKMLQSGLIKSMPAYISILEGAPTQHLYKTELGQNDLIQRENESMMKGERVQALATDTHAQHIYEHNGLLNDPMVRKNPEMVQLVLDHLEEHNQLQKSTDPMLMAMAQTGQAPQMAAPPPGGPQEGELPPAPGEAPIGPTGGPLPLSGEPAQEVAQPAEDELGRQV